MTVVAVPPAGVVVAGVVLAAGIYYVINDSHYRSARMLVKNQNVCDFIIDNKKFTVTEDDWARLGDIRPARARQLTWILEAASKGQERNFELWEARDHKKFNLIGNLTTGPILMQGKVEGDQTKLSKVFDSVQNGHKIYPPQTGAQAEWSCIAPRLLKLQADYKKSTRLCYAWNRTPETPTHLLGNIKDVRKSYTVDGSTATTDTNNVIAWWVPEFPRTPTKFWFHKKQRTEEYLYYKFLKHTDNDLEDEVPLQYETDTEYEDAAGKLLMGRLYTNNLEHKLFKEFDNRLAVCHTVEEFPVVIVDTYFDKPSKITTYYNMESKQLGWNNIENQKDQ